MFDLTDEAGLLAASERQDAAYQKKIAYRCYKRMFDIGMAVLLIPALMRSGVHFWVALAAGCVLTVALYFAMLQLGPRIGLGFLRR